MTEKSLCVIYNLWAVSIDRYGGGVTSEIDGKILDRLQEWEQREGQLPSFAQFYRELLQIQSEAKSRIVVTKPDLDKDSVRARLSDGVPLLSFEQFSPDWQEVQTVFKQIAVWAAKDSKDLSGESKSLGKISRNLSLLRKVAKDWYQGRSLASVAATEGIDSGLLTSVVAAALKPFLSVYSTLLLPEVEQEQWRRRYCPICGGKPDFAYLDRDKGARWLVCSHCDAEWLFLRLECPYCGTQNQDNLSYLADGEGSHLYRLYICEQCHTYIKAIDLRCTESEVLLPFERGMTLDLDRLGQDKGYRPGWVT